MRIDPVELGTAITRRAKRLREALGLSQREVDRRAGFSAGTVCRFEGGERARDMPASTVLALAQALGADPGFLLTGKKRRR